MISRNFARFFGVGRSDPFRVGADAEAELHLVPAFFDVPPRGKFFHPDETVVPTCSEAFYVVSGVNTEQFHFAAVRARRRSSLRVSLGVCHQGIRSVRQIGMPVSTFDCVTDGRSDEGHLVGHGPFDTGGSVYVVGHVLGEARGFA